MIYASDSIDRFYSTVYIVVNRCCYTILWCTVRDGEFSIRVDSAGIRSRAPKRMYAVYGREDLRKNLWI